MILFFFVLCLTYVLYKWITLRPLGFPPGPPAVPFLGSLPFLDFNLFHLKLKQLRKQHGPIIGLKFGSSNAIAICGAAEVQEALKKEEFQGRPVFSLRDKLFEHGVMFTQGSYWAQHRRFALRHLRDFGFGRTSTEQVILEEYEELSSKILNKQKQIQISQLFNNSAINVLWAMIGGKRFELDDADFKNLLFYLNRSFRSGNVSGGVLNALPFLRFIFPKWTGFQEDQENKAFILNFLEQSIEEHKKDLSPDLNRDLIDVYLNDMKSENSSFNILSLIGIANELFTGGAESTGNSIGFAVLYLVLYPDLQQQLYDEIKKVVGENRRPCLADKPNMPVMEAFLSETMRCNTIAPLTVPHTCMSDTYFNGYFIPKDTFMLISLWSMLQDKEHWGDPENFRPSRFLNAEGKYVKDDWLTPFGIGKRICLGENLARSVQFLFVVSLVQDYEFGLPEGHPKPSTVCLPGFTTAPQPFEVTLRKRITN